MTTTDTTPPTTAGLDAAGRRRVLVVLCSTQITSWGILYYAFPVLSTSITAGTGWSAQAITAAFSLGQLAAALTGIPVGRILDRVGPRTVMTAGSALAAPAVAIVALAPNLSVFYLGWLLAGTAMGAVLYPPAFAALTRWHGEQRVRALMILTLVGGLASTVFAPLTAAVDVRTDWRVTYLILAAALAAITIPTHWFGLRGHWPDPPPVIAGAGFDRHDQVARSRAFLALTVALALGAFTAFAGVFNLVPLLIERGFTPETAALTLGLGGAGQVLGRLGYLQVAARTRPRTRLIAALAGTAASTALLGLADTVIGLIAISIGAGLVRGVTTLVQATAITDRWGPTHYGSLNGVLNAPIVIVMASAPWAGTALTAATGSYANAYLVLAAVAALAALVGAAATPTLRTASEPVVTEGHR
ncbi:MFS transporter [Nocardia shimofusensis]|uniref:MFS transporter n=1 Tax=Nocardia shimofusensis TaxID=228596 RepID=UPI00082D7985|nr:MFS transporter [Nocardia shimofusensis]